MTGAAHPAEPLGAILAGGASRRFGSPKALAEVGGKPIVARVRDALAVAVPRVVLIDNEPELFTGLGLRSAPDDVPGTGPLAGIRRALAWARDEHRHGALCLACDMPFVTPALLLAILTRARINRADAVVPESGGRRGVEPLCAWYSSACIPAIDGLIARGEAALVGLLDRVRTERVPLGEVAALGDPEVLFFNVNTAQDHWRALLIAQQRG